MVLAVTQRKRISKKEQEKSKKKGSAPFSTKAQEKAATWYLIYWYYLFINFNFNSGNGSMGRNSYLQVSQTFK